MRANDPECGRDIRRPGYNAATEMWGVEFRDCDGNLRLAYWITREGAERWRSRQRPEALSDLPTITFAGPSCPADCNPVWRALSPLYVGDR